MCVADAPALPCRAGVHAEQAATGTDAMDEFLNAFAHQAAMVSGPRAGLGVTPGPMSAWQRGPAIPLRACSCRRTPPAGGGALAASALCCCCCCALLQAKDRPRLPTPPMALPRSKLQPLSDTLDQELLFKYAGAVGTSTWSSSTLSAAQQQQLRSMGAH